MRQPRALVLTGDGINCEFETAHALSLAGFKAEVRHLNDLIAVGLTSDQLSREYSCLALPGGFSFGDDLGSGRILALKMSHGLKWKLHEFADRGGMVIGICNGFQALIRLGVFGSGVSITHNRDGQFLDDWVELQASDSKNKWLKGLGDLWLPIRHGEGRIVVQKTQPEICLQYKTDPNGSFERTAGLTDNTGRILGLMPHPEAFVRFSQAPWWNESPSKAFDEAPGLQLFRNAFLESREKV